MARYQATVLRMPVSKRLAGTEAELALDLPRVDGVAAIVSGAVLHESDQRGGLAAARPPGIGETRGARTGSAANASSTSRQSSRTMSMLRHSFRPPTLYVSPDLPREQHPLDRPAVVLDVEPVAHVEPVAVDRQRLALERVHQHERDQLLGKLERPVVVRAVARRDRQPVGVVVGPNQVVGRGLARRVRRVGRVGGVLAERRDRPAPSEPYTSSVETWWNRTSARPSPLVQPDAPRRLQQRVGPDHVGVDEGVGAVDRAVHVRFGREVHDRSHVVLPEQARRELVVADVAAHEGELRLRPDGFEAGQIPGVGQGVEHDDAIGRMRAQPVMDEVGADEPGTTGHEETTQGSETWIARRSFAGSEEELNCTLALK